MANMHQTVAVSYNNNEYITHLIIEIFKNNLWVSFTQQNQSAIEMSESKKYTEGGALVSSF